MTASSYLSDKQLPSGLHKFYATHLVFVLTEDGQLFSTNACKADRKSEKSMHFLRLVCLFESK